MSEGAREKITTKTITTREGLKLVAQTRRQNGNLEVCLQAPARKRLVLHWGVHRPDAPGWALPPKLAWPPGSVPAGPTAVQTAFTKANGEFNLVIRLSPAAEFEALEFALFFPDEGRWDNNGGRNYQVPLAEPRPKPRDTLRARVGTEEALLERIFDLPGGGQLAAAVTKAGEHYRVRLICDRGRGLVLHWGVARRSPHEWLVPPEHCRTPDTQINEGAADTPFSADEGMGVLQLDFPAQEAPLGIQFVLRDLAKDGWINYRSGNFYLPVQVRHPGAASGGAGEHADIADEIIRAETTHNSWTLMHRFNLCHDLLDRVRGSLEGLVLIYVYLRFSAIRQLTWQKSYNTKPRELAHAQDRLTQKLVVIYRSEPASRGLVRAILATVGRGGEGQRIRDEILNIMHRHHIKEVSGHFLEEWHQKLHNNTTPDDLVICEAYLSFLNSNGNLDSFYRALQAGGVTRQRLETFERPIRSHPDFVPHLKNALTHDFEHFLKILKASHSGTDLETAINAARGQVDHGFQGLLNHIWENRNQQGEAVLDLVRHITEARRGLSGMFGREHDVRELLYLDLALEQLLRAAVERNLHLRLGGDQLVDLIAWILENVTLSYEDSELAACSRHWDRLKSIPRFGAQWSLHAKSVVDRVARALSAWIDRVYQLLQPKAEFLGESFRAEPWTITLFSEEVVRGSSLGFVLSTLLRHLDPLLRQAARIGNWQIISRGQGFGQVEVVDALGSIQGKRFESARVVVADKVSGEEEIPEGVTAVIAPDVVDIVSHVAVRARNGNVLFASCHDGDLLQHLKSLRGRHVQLEVTPAGDVIAAEITGEPSAKTARPQRQFPAKGRLKAAAATSPKGSAGKQRYAIPSAEFGQETVGSKAWRQAQLRGRLPEWICLPASAAIPFGVFETVLGLELNQNVSKRYSELVRQTQKAATEPLTALRETVLGLVATPEFKDSVREAMISAGLPWPDDWETVWNRIKRVWASKWNERAYLSRQRIGLPDDELFMSVLIQQVVPADYAFVLHTVNPSNGNRDELFGEVVLGLGETLVGNHPGRALSFVAQKATGETSILSFPSKSAGLYGEGLIFRSDSNGEDLAGYAGAGLYDSVLLQPPAAVELDYAREPLVWDEGFRHELLFTLTKLGMEVERTMGSPQDIEGTVGGKSYYVVQTRPQVGL